ncbi:MAG: ZPR1 zinc finger domain-containing protein [archaeon]
MASNEETKQDVLSGQPCPMCSTNNLTLTEKEMEIPYFGVCYLFSMDCSNCDYHIADIEAAETREPCKYTFEYENENDLKVRVVKSSQATVKIPRIVTISPGPVSNGYVTNIEGILNRVKNILETQRDDEEDSSAQKKAKNMLKKIQRVLWGREKLTVIIEDPTGNSAIISDKAIKSKL